MGYVQNKCVAHIQDDRHRVFSTLDIGLQESICRYGGHMRFHGLHKLLLITESTSWTNYGQNIQHLAKVFLPYFFFITIPMFAITSPRYYYLYFIYPPRQTTFLLIFIPTCVICVTKMTNSFNSTYSLHLSQETGFVSSADIWWTQLYLMSYQSSKKSL